MTVTAIRETLHGYIDSVDDKELENIYTLLEDKIAHSWEWSEDKEFVAELDERVRRYEAGIDRAYTWNELEASLAEMKKNRAAK